VTVPPPDSVPTPYSEIRDLRGEIRDFRNEMKDFRNWAERLYVPRGEWVEGRRADQGYIKDVAKDVEELKAKDTALGAWKRTVLGGVLVAAFSAALTTAITFAVVILGKGSS
jgi:hypothetical protein